MAKHLVQFIVLPAFGMLLEMWREHAGLYGIDPFMVKIEKQREILGESWREMTRKKPCDPR